MFPTGLPADFHSGASAGVYLSEDRAGQSGTDLEPQRCLAAAFVAILLRLQQRVAMVDRGIFVRGDE
jgi:hypothetical protein